MFAGTEDLMEGVRIGGDSVSIFSDKAGEVEPPFRDGEHRFLENFDRLLLFDIALETDGMDLAGGLAVGLRSDGKQLGMGIDLEDLLSELEAVETGNEDVEQGQGRAQLLVAFQALDSVGRLTHEFKVVAVLKVVGH